MTLQEAQEKLALLRKRQKRLRTQIDELREFIFEQGENPDRPEVELAERNRDIYRLFKKGHSYTELGKHYNLSASRIRGICIRIDYQIRHRQGGYRFFLKR